MSKEQIDNYSEQSYNLEHQDSISSVIEIATEMDKRGVNKAFSTSLRKLVKKSKFHYEEF